MFTTNPEVKSSVRFFGEVADITTKELRKGLPPKPEAEYFTHSLGLAYQYHAHIDFALALKKGWT